MKKLVVLVDDSFPHKSFERIPSNKLQELIKLPDSQWKSEVNLKKLTQKILALDLFKNGSIELLAYVHPELLLNDIIDEATKPDVIVYDWEYNSKSEDSGSILAEILEKTDSYAFVYSSFFDAVPPVLNQQKYDEVADRFYLLQKGDRHSSIFSAEEKIIQHIHELFENQTTVEFSNHKIRFTPSEYIDKPSEINLLESVFEKGFLLQNLEKIDYAISKESIERLFKLVDDCLFLSSDKKNILSENSELMTEKYGPLTPINYLEALQSLGLKGLDIALHSGIKSIN